MLLWVVFVVELLDGIVVGEWLFWVVLSSVLFVCCLVM